MWTDRRPPTTSPGPVFVTTTWAVTRAVCVSRLAFPDPELVQNPIVASSNLTTHTGVATGVPSRRKVLTRMYFSSSNVTRSRYRPEA